PLPSQAREATEVTRNRHVIQQSEPDRRDRRNGTAGRRSGTCSASQRPIQGTRSEPQSRPASRTRDEVVKADLDRPETLRQCPEIISPESGRFRLASCRGPKRRK